MAKHSSCSTEFLFADAQAQPVLDAQRIVIWAGELADEGEPVGSIGTQINRAARLLRLHHGVVWRARYLRAGPEIFPAIEEARRQLLERIAKQKRSPWHSPISVRPSARSSDNLRACSKKARAVP